MKIGVVIGRFQPFHQGHAEILKKATKENDKTIVVIGSANRSRSIKNPFTFAERREMIRDWSYAEFADKLTSQYTLEFVESPDNLYKEWSWKSEIVRRINDKLPTGAQCKINLYGHFKDSSSYYLKEFPEWNLVEVNNFHGVDATQFRESFLEDGIVSKHYLPESTVCFMKNFKETAEYKDLCADWDFFKWEKKAFSEYPFPETLNFVCSDCVVICQGHVLLIQRTAAPGRNTWALPGGFKNNNETFEECAIRELKEETNLRVPSKVLQGSIKNSNMFDDPRRSLGIPRMSMSYYIDLQPNANGSLPEVRPASDAYNAKWIPLSDALAMNLFEDHLDIILWFV